MKKPIDAEGILRTIDKWSCWLFPAWDMERKIEAYANGGTPPSETSNCDEDIVPLGMASTHMKKEMDPLLDAISLLPGYVDMEYTSPAINDPDRTMAVTTYVNSEVNAVLAPYNKVQLYHLAGRSTVTGRGALYRMSPNDFKMKNGRMIHPPEAGVDTLDAEFREWAFPGKISLRTIDERLDKTEDNRVGWQRKGLKALKEWVLASEAEKYRYSKAGTASGAVFIDWKEKFDLALWNRQELASCGYVRPVDVYWYYRKNGKITENDQDYGGHEGVDLYCISRFGSQCDVRRTVRDDIEYARMEASYPENGRKELKRMQEEANYTEEEWKENEIEKRLIFYLPDAFKSVRDCLVFHNDDARVAGEQLMSEVRGNGKTAMPKLSVMEGLLTSLIDGLGFAATPMWSVAPGTAPEYMDQLQRGGLRSGQAFPNTINPVAKQNAMVGFGSAMSAIQMMDSAAAADSAAAQQGTFGSQNAEFAGQAAAQMDQQARIASRRVNDWLMTLDQLAVIQVRTLCRHWPDMKKAYPCYYDADRMRKCLKVKYGVHEDEWDAQRWTPRARRLAGGMLKQQAVAINIQAIQMLGPIFPSLIPFFGKELLRTWYGDTMAAQLTQGESSPAQKGQEEDAALQITIAFTTGSPPPVKPMDNPMIHSGAAGKLARERATAAIEAGTITRGELVGIMAVIQYAASQMQRLPEQIAKAGLKELENIAAAVQGVPIKSANEDQLSQKDALALQIKNNNLQRLSQEGERKWQLAQNKEMIALDNQNLKRRMADSQEKTLAVNRAQMYQQLETDAAEQNGDIEIENQLATY